jgi:hypothetical protein
MLNRLKINLVTVVLVLGSMGVAAHAGTLIFNFNSLADTATAAQIQSYMQGVLTPVCGTCTVTITGAFADTTYTATGNVVGPGGTPLTLGTSDGAANNSGTAHGGANDAFLATVNDADTSHDSEITLVFSSGISFSNAAFDYEIFPDAVDTGDFTLQSGNGGTLANVTGFGSGGTVAAVAPSTKTNGTSTSSPAGDNNVQYIAKWTGSLGTSSSGYDDIDFVDWPEAIGIDNLVLTYTLTPSVPEPSSIFLFGTVGALLFKFRRSLTARGKNQQPLV